ncbi:MAG: BrnT family toxin [Thermomicrobiales bacterium]
MPDWSQPEFEWDDGNEGHLIVRHDVYPAEAEQVFYNGAHIRRTGNAYYAYGRDDTGRYLFLFVLRGRAVRVFSARTMTREERKFYERNQ